MTRRTVPVEWITVDEALPDDDMRVLLTIEGDPDPWVGSRDGDRWCDDNGVYLGRDQHVTAWAEWPQAYAS